MGVVPANQRNVRESVIKALEGAKTALKKSPKPELAEDPCAVLLANSGTFVRW